MGLLERNIISNPSRVSYCLDFLYNHRNPGLSYMGLFHYSSSLLLILIIHDLKHGSFAIPTCRHLGSIGLCRSIHRRGLKMKFMIKVYFLICVMKRGKALISWAWPPLSLFWHTPVTSGHMDDQLFYTWNNLKFATGLLVAVIKKAVNGLQLTWSLKKVVSSHVLANWGME